MSYCYVHRTTPPFAAFQALRKLAIESVGEDNVLDISQGEPGYGFTPSIRSRQFASFFNLLDAELNNTNNEKLFSANKPSDSPEIEKKIRETAEKYYKPEIAEKLLSDWNYFVSEFQKICDNQGLSYGKFEIYYELFKYSNLTGGRYPQPTGHPLLKALLAEKYSGMLKTKVWEREIIPVSGASQGIAAVFKTLGGEGVDFLGKDDTVLMISPVYAPYREICNGRGFKMVTFSIDPETGEFDESEIDKCIKYSERIKAIILIDPNNPTGFPGDDKFLKAITDIAEAHNSIIISDEVYFRFFEGKKSIAEFPSARKRLIRIEAISKIERSTGLRVGDVYIPKEANEYITNNILKGCFENEGHYKDVFSFTDAAKAPGGINIGIFQHITGIPGPSVAMTLFHLILGESETEEVRNEIKEKMKLFYETLGLPYHGNLYYGMLDFLRVGCEQNKDVPIQEKLERIAKKGVVLMPSYLFFSLEDRLKKDRNHFVRASLPNLSKNNVKKAAEIIKEVLDEEIIVENN